MLLWLGTPNHRNRTFILCTQVVWCFFLFWLFSPGLYCRGFIRYLLWISLHFFYDIMLFIYPFDLSSSGRSWKTFLILLLLYSVFSSPVDLFWSLAIVNIVSFPFLYFFSSVDWMNTNSQFLKLFITEVLFIFAKGNWLFLHVLFIFAKTNFLFITESFIFLPNETFFRCSSDLSNA